MADGQVDGTIAFKDGRFIVTDPAGGGKPAVLVPAPGLVIMVNGTPLTAPMPVSSADTIAVYCPGEETEGAIDVSISRDCLSAAVVIRPHIVRIRNPAECAPTNRLTPPVDEKIEENWVFTAEDVLAALAEKGVVSGIDTKLIRAAVAARDRTAHVIARGVPPSPGTDGLVERLFPGGPVPVAPATEREAVDYRQRFIIPLVKEGDVLAILHPAVPGEPGKTVTGELIPAKAVRHAMLQAGPGAALTPDGLTVVATRAGMPVAEGTPLNRVIRVEHVLDHQGNVDLASGNLFFDGEIVVRGDVLPGMTVRATGGVVINGMVDTATVEAGRSIHVGGSVIGSTLKAGGPKATGRMRRFLAKLDQVADDLAQLIQGCEEPGTDRWLNIAPADMSEMRDRIASLSEWAELEGFGPPAEVSTLLRMAQRLAAGLGTLSGQEPQELGELVSALNKAWAVTARLLPAPADIRVAYAQNSTLEADGKIHVTGQGCYYTTLRAGIKVRIEKDFRAGTVRADEHISIGRVGSPAAADKPCEISVGDRGTVELGQVFPDVTVRIGHRSHRFENALRGVRMFIDEQGDIHMEGIPV